MYMYYAMTQTSPKSNHKVNIS